MNNIEHLLLKPEQFIYLQVYLVLKPKHKEYFERHIETINESIKAGEIRNVEYKEINEDIGRIIDDAFDLFNRPLWDIWRDIEFNDELRGDIYHVIGGTGISIYAIPSKLKAVEKFAKKYASANMSNISEPLTQFWMQMMPLNAAMTHLKPLIVKGRKPAEPKPVDPNRVERTCPCCLRSIAVVRGTMAIHGYNRDDWSWTAASCAGARFQPLERSNEGLIYIIDVFKTVLADNQENLKNLPIQTELPYNERVKGVVTTKMITADHPRFEVTRINIENRYKSTIRQMESNIKYFGEKLENWKQTEFDF